MSRTDLSGRWNGIFNYPDALPATHFTAVLDDTAGVLGGHISESHYDGGRTVQASVHGTREGSLVLFIKLYDALDGEYDEVAYRGEVDAAGQEISGRWEIAQVWSGSFIMVRDAAGQIGEEIKAADMVDRVVPVQ